MEKDINTLIAAQRELNAKMVSASEDELKTLQREYDANKREIDTINQKTVAERNAPKAAKKTLVAQLREAMKSNQRSVTVTAIHDDVIDNDVQGILDPLYANSVLAQAGCRWYKGMPMGDIQIPVMGKGTVGWASEIAAASASTNTFTHKTLKPKRLTAYVDVSKTLIVQDTVGAEEAIRRDLVNAIAEKLQDTILGAAASSDDQPAGMFYGQTISAATTTFAGLTALEATVEANNVYGDMKYILSPAAKADLRAMAKSTKNTQLVYEGGEVDGVPALTTSSCNSATAGSFIYGNFENLAIASWNDIEITIDEYTQAVNGCIRLVVNAYFDAAILREGAFAYGKTR